MQIDKIKAYYQRQQIIKLEMIDEISKLQEFVGHDFCQRRKSVENINVTSSFTPIAK